MTKEKEFIPWARPDLWGREREYVDQALASSWISGGPFLDRLEADFLALSKSAHTFAVANGTVAIQLAYLALGLRPGDEVIVPGFGFLAAANVALQMSVTPVFCEVDSATWCARADQIEKVISSKTRAIVVVHTYGNVCDMDSIMVLAKKHDLPVIEDAAEAFPSYYKGHLTGTLGTLGTYSFQATKTITTGEGGMVVTNDAAIAERMMLLRSHGLRRKRHYWHELPGLNFRLTNMQAALGCAQFEKLDVICAERRRVYASYQQCFSGMAGVTLQTVTANVDTVIWAVALRLSPEIFPQGRDRVIEEMLEAGIELRPGFYAPSQLDFYDCPKLPICETLASSIISVPSFPTLTDDMIQRVCNTLARLAKI